MDNKFRKLFDRFVSRYVSTGFIFLMDVGLSFISALLDSVAVQ